MKSIMPLSSRLIPRIFPQRALEDTAIEKKIIAPQEQRNLSPALFLNGQLDKITDVHEFSAGLSDEIRKATSRTANHFETIAYRLKNLCLSNGQLCSYTNYKKLTHGKINFKPEKISSNIDKAALCSTAAGNDYFSHFLYDDACSALMAKSFAQPIFANIGKKRTEHEIDYLKRFNINLQDLNTAYIKTLWIFKDISLNSHRRKRIQQLRYSLAVSPQKSTATGVYIRRGNKGAQRRLSNEADIEDALQAIGFDIISPEQLSVTELVTRINGSSIVVGVEGSQLVHGLLNLKPQGTLLCIQPPDRFNAIYRPFTDAAGLRWAFVVGDGNRQAFTLCISDLMKTIDKCFSDSS